MQNMLVLETMDAKDTIPKDNIQFVIELCKTKASYSCKLDPRKFQRHTLNLKYIKENFLVKSDAGIALVVEEKTGNNTFEIIIHEYGELLFKTTEKKNIPAIEKIAHKIYKLGLNA